MTKAEELINKHLILEGGSDLAITDGRIYNAFLNAINEAINYRAEVKVELVAAREAQAQMINLSKIV